jgi:hypothetical protein
LMRHNLGSSSFRQQLLSRSSYSTLHFMPS